MTTLGPQIQDFDLPQFVFLNNKHAKMSNKTNNTATISHGKPNGSNQRTKTNNKTNQHRQSPKAHDYYPAKLHPMTVTSKFSVLKYDGGKQYAKGNFSKASQDSYYNKLYYASTASDSDSSSSSGAQSEITANDLIGFKIAHNGKLLHDDTEDEFGYPTDFELSLGLKTEKVKFASSTMVIGPNPKDISLPSFV
jgi:hypothetical protein